MSEKTKEVKNFKIQCILEVCMVKLSMNISYLGYGPCIHEYF